MVDFNEYVSLRLDMCLLFLLFDILLLQNLHCVDLVVVFPLDEHHLCIASLSNDCKQTEVVEGYRCGIPRCCHYVDTLHFHSDKIILDETTVEGLYVVASFITHAKKYQVVVHAG